MSIESPKPNEFLEKYDLAHSIKQLADALLEREQENLNMIVPLEFAETLHKLSEELSQQVGIQEKQLSTLEKMVDLFETMNDSASQPGQTINESYESLEKIVGLLSGLLDDCAHIEKEEKNLPANIRSCFTKIANALDEKRIKVEKRLDKLNYT